MHNQAIHIYNDDSGFKVLGMKDEGDLSLRRPGGVEVLVRGGSADGEEDREENETVEETEGDGEKEDLVTRLVK